MPGISRVGVDAAGATIVGNLAPTVFVNGSPIVVQGAAIVGHGEHAHAGPHMQGHSFIVFANGIGVCRTGDYANCGHTATGSSDVFAGESAVFRIGGVRMP